MSPFSQPAILLGLALLFVTAHPGVAADENADRSLAEFEGAGFDGWVAIGKAFGTGPDHTPAGSPGSVGGFRGNGRAHSGHGSADATGVLRSPPIRLDRRYLCLLIAGPTDVRRAGVRVLVGQRVVATLAAPEASFLNTATADLGAFRDSEIVIEVFDDDPGPGGEIHVDAIRLADRAATPPTSGRRNGFLSEAP